MTGSERSGRGCKSSTARDGGEMSTKMMNTFPSLPSAEGGSVCLPLTVDVDRDKSGADDGKSGHTEGEEECGEAQCYFSWNAGIRSSLSAELTRKRRRYMALLPLNWGTQKNSTAVLNRDLVTGNLVVVWHYRYHHNKEPIAHHDEAGWTTDDSFVPFTTSWKQRIQILQNLRHAYINPLVDLLMDEEHQELLLVQPYVDGMQPLASLLQPHPCLIQRPMTPVWLNRIAREIITGVMYLHDHNIVHGALSPWTILLDVKGHVSVMGFAVLDNLSNEIEDVLAAGGVDLMCMPPASRRRIPTEAGDALSIAAIMLEMMKNERDVVYIEMREALKKVMHESLQQPMTIAELAATLDVHVSPRHRLHSVSRGEGVDLRGAATQPSTTDAAAPLPLRQLQHEGEKELPITGILQRDISPVLYRTTGLGKWRRLKAAVVVQGAKSPASMRGSLNRSIRRVISNWRVAAMAVIFCIVLISRRKLKKKKVLAAPVLFVESLQRRMVPLGVAPIVSAPMTSRPRRPTSAHRRHSVYATSTTVVQRESSVTVVSGSHV